VLRRTLMAASRSERLQRVATEARPARRVARRFVAGETLDEALEVAEVLNKQGMSASLDHLGEAVDDETVARHAAKTYMRALDRIAEEDLDASISVKLTQLGIDVSPDLCRGLVADICARAAETTRAVTIDMESSAYTDVTVDLVLALREDGHDNVGCAVQAYLHRTPEDVERLVAAGASLRLCKGAYLEPPDIAYRSRREISSAFAMLAERLLESGTYPLIATHDHRLVHHVKNVVRRLGLDRDAYEFQMLYGVREPLQRELVADGHRLRIYVPFGDEWYPYLVRRLAERPANLAFFLRAVAGRRG
jgi:proline dehydrogenase